MHTRLSYFLGLFKFLQGLAELLVRDLPLTFFLVVKVQAPALQLLKMVLGREGL